MPYDIRKSGSGYKVFGPSGPKSDEPLSKGEAMAQLRALYANTKDEAGGGGGGRKRVGVRARATGDGGGRNPIHSSQTHNEAGATGAEDTARLAAKAERAAARIGVRGRGPSGEACCPICGEEGCSAMRHIEGTAGPGRVGPRGGEDEGPYGPALEQDRATQGYDAGSSRTTGNPNYRSPGSAGGMT